MKHKVKHWLRAILTELERGILCAPFFLSMIATVAVLFFGSTGLWFPTDEMLENGLDWEYYLTVLDTGCKSEAFIFCLPLLAAFPAGISVLTDIRSGFLKSYLGRCGFREYMTGKLLLAILGGGGSVFAGYMAAAGIMGMIYRPLSRQAVEESVSQWPQMWAQALVVFLAGTFFSLLASTLGLIFGNRYMAFGGAFMVSYLLIIVTSRYLTAIYTLNPREWLRQEKYWEGGYLGCAGFVGELCVLMAIFYWQIMFARIGPGKRQRPRREITKVQGGRRSDMGAPPGKGGAS